MTQGATSTLKIVTLDHENNFACGPKLGTCKGTSVVLYLLSTILLPSKIFQNIVNKISRRNNQILLLRLLFCCRVEYCPVGFSSLQNVCEM